MGKQIQASFTVGQWGDLAGPLRREGQTEGERTDGREPGVRSKLEPALWGKEGTKFRHAMLKKHSFETQRQAVQMPGDCCGKSTGRWGLESGQISHLADPWSRLPKPIISPTEKQRSDTTELIGIKGSKQVTILKCPGQCPIQSREPNDHHHHSLSTGKAASMPLQHSSNRCGYEIVLN